MQPTQEDAALGSACLRSAPLSTGILSMWTKHLYLSGGTRAPTRPAAFCRRTGDDSRRHTSLCRLRRCRECAVASAAPQPGTLPGSRKKAKARKRSDGTHSSPYDHLKANAFSVTVGPLSLSVVASGAKQCATYAHVPQPRISSLTLATTIAGCNSGFLEISLVELPKSAWAKSWWAH